jgi:hypothetical protein
MDVGDQGSEALPTLVDEESTSSARKAPLEIGQASASNETGDNQGMEGNAGSPTASTDTQGDYQNNSGSDSTQQGLPGASGPMTQGEKIAVLDAELERATGVFDQIILDAQSQQRESDTESNTQYPAGAEAGSTDNNQTYGRMPGGMGSQGGGGGMRTGEVSAANTTAKYPPPGDIPSGDDDDVIARQLREAAMREPDPAVREKLWDEYRKYKGINQG